MLLLYYKKKKGLNIMADTLKTLNCPACGNKMEKVFIKELGINIDICTQGCGGIFFDNREFDYFDEQNEDISKILEKLEGKNFTKVSENTTRKCPNCGANMVKNHSSVSNAIEVDDCYSCGGKFLDYGELEKIRAEYENNEQRDQDILSFVYKQVGQELAETDELYSKTITDRTLLQKVFYKLLNR